MKESGFTLLEVLVALLVLSIGLLGLAGLTASSMRNNLSASHRSQAIWQAYDIVDRMRANRASAIAGAYNTAFVATPVCTTTAPSGTVAQRDLAAWRNQIACAMPDGNGSVAVNAGTRQAVIVIRWNDSRGTQGGVAQSFRVDTQL